MPKATNVFNAGMHQDNDEHFQPKGSVRLARNKRLINNGNNNFIYDSVKGNTVSFSLRGSAYRVLGWYSFDDTIYILSTPDSSAGGGWGEIGKVIINESTGTGTYTTIYVHADLNFTLQKPVYNDAIFFNDENIGVGRLYWTDDFNSPRVLNLNHDVLNTIIASGSIVSGVSYMVTTDTVVYDGVTYGPDEAAGSVFTGNGSGPTYTGTGLVIEYLALTSLEWSPNFLIGDIRFKNHALGGAVPCGAYLAFFRLSDSQGFRTPWSFSTSLVYVGQEDIGSLERSYHDYQGDEASAISNKILNFDVLDIDRKYRNIEVAILRFTDKNVFANAFKIFDGLITSDSMAFGYDGLSEFGDISIDELQEILVTFNLVRTFGVTKNRLFPGNVTTRGELGEFDPSGTDVSAFTYAVPSDVFAFDTDIVPFDPILYPTNVYPNPLSGHKRAENFIPAATAKTIYTKGQYIVLLGDALYNGVVYKIGDIFEGVTGVDQYTVSAGSPLVQAVIIIDRYEGPIVASGSLVVGSRYEVVTTPVTHNSKAYSIGESFLASATTYTGAGTVRFKDAEIIQIKEDFYDNKGLTVGSYLKSRMRGETYRVGWMARDLKGNPFFVRWMKDITMPKMSEAGFELINNHGSNDQYSLNHLGLKIGTTGSPLDLGLNASKTGLCDELGIAEADLPDYISGFEIVVAKREKNTVAQGLMFYTVKNNTFSLFTRPEGLHRLDYTDVTDTIPTGLTDGPHERTYVVVSPDLLFEDEDAVAIDPNAYEMEIVEYLTSDVNALEPKVDAGIAETRDSFGNKFFHFSKFYKTVAPTAAGHPVGTINPISSITKIGSVGYGFISDWDDDFVGFNFNHETGTETTAIGSASRGGTHGIAHIVVGEDAIFGDVTPSFNGRALVNIKKRSGAAYGEKELTQYYSTGHWQPINADVYAANGNSWKFKGIEVWGGDINLSIFDYKRIYGINTSIGSPTLGNEYDFSYFFATESNVNVDLRRGRHIARDRSKSASSSPNGVALGNIENLIIDGAYNSTNQAVIYSALPAQFNSNTVFSRRVHYSDIKFNGELIDSFRVYRVNNFRDLENSGKEIMSLIRKEGKLYCWQKYDWIFLPVNERTTISSPLGDAIQLGVGGVLDRFDEINERYGLQDRDALVSTDKGFIWIDKSKTALVMANISGGVQKLDIVKGLKSFIQGLLYKTDLATKDQSLQSVGISAGYNERFNEVLFSFRSADNENITLGFDESQQAFTSFYDFVPHNYLTHKGFLYTDVNRTYNTLVSATAYAIGDVVIGSTEKTKVYVNILALTTTTPPIEPDIDTTHWQPAADVSEVYLQDDGDICKFYGVVYDEFIEVIINDAPIIEKVFDSLAITFEREMYTEVTYSNSYQSVTELAADTTFRFRNRMNQNSIPREVDKSRIRDYWLKVTLRRNHFDGGTDPLTSDNKSLKLVSLITNYRNSI